jgi:hypothetical protein
MGFIVLQGQNREDLIDLARCHSRRIHLLLIEENVNNRSLAALLQQYRRTMRVFFVGEDEALLDVIAPELVSEKVRHFFEMLYGTQRTKDAITAPKTMKNTSLLDLSEAQVAGQREAESLKNKRRGPIASNAA